MNAQRTISTRLLLGIVISLAAPAIVRSDITSNLQLRYRMDDISSTSVPDTSGNNRTGTLTGGATFTTAGRVGGAVNLDGADGTHIDGPVIAATDNAEELTVAFWINVDDLYQFDLMCSKWEDVDNTFSVQVGGPDAGGDDDVVVFVYKESGLDYVFTTGNVLSEGTWIHVAVVFDGGETGDLNRLKIYINGQLAARDEEGDMPATLHTDTSGDWLIGWRDDTPNGYAFDGKVDEFYLFTRALTAVDVVELYSRSAGSILFNGGLTNANSKLENTTADLLEGSTEVTICAWIYPQGAGEANAGVVTAIDEAGSAVRLQHNSGTALRLIDVRDATNGEWTFPITNNAWNAVALTYDRVDPFNNPPRVRVNLLDVTETPVEAADGIHVPAGVGYCVGNLSNQSQTWNRRIAHVQVFNRMLSPAEMDACLRTPGSISRGLRLWLPMTNASDVNDRSGNGFHATATAVDTGADGPPVFSSPNVPPGITMVPPVEVQIVNNEPVWKYTTVTQHVIPRYAWGVLQPAIWSGTRSIAPAGELRGWGPMSVIRGNSSTELLSDLIDYRAVVITEDIDRITAMFGSGEYQQNLKPAVLRPVIRDVSIWGHDDTSTNYTDNGKVSNQPAVDNPIGSWPAQQRDELRN